MVEAKLAFGRLRECQPVRAGGFQQAISANNVGLDKVRRPVDGAVNVGLGGQVHDGLRLEALDDCTDRCLVDDVGLDEFVAGVGCNALQRFKVTGVGQLVEVEHFVCGVPDKVPD